MASQNDPGARSPRTTKTEIEFFPRRSIGDDGMRLDVPPVSVEPDATVVLAEIPVPVNCALQVYAVHFLAWDAGGRVDAMASLAAVCIRLLSATPIGEDLMQVPAVTGGILTTALVAVSIVAGGPTGFLLRIVQNGETGEGAEPMTVQARFVVGASPLPS